MQDLPPDHSDGSPVSGTDPRTKGSIGQGPPPMLRPIPRQPWMRRNELHRILFLGLFLFVVLVAMRRARNPRSWEWLTGPSSETAIRPADPGKVRTQANRHQHNASFNPLNLLHTDECTEVNNTLFEGIEDKTPTEMTEVDAIRQLLCVAATISPEQLGSLARRDVTFGNLFNQPELWRGKAIHLEGTLARLTEYQLDDRRNPYGLTRYYEAWIFTEQQRQFPMVVLFSSLPLGLQPGQSVDETVSADAFFLKLHAYAAADEKWRAAPLLVGYSPVWNKAETTSFALEDWWWLGGMFALGAVLLLFVLWLNHRDDQLFEQMRRDVLSPDNPDLRYLDGDSRPRPTHRPDGPNPSHESEPNA